MPMFQLCQYSLICRLLMETRCQVHTSLFGLVLAVSVRCFNRFVMHRFVSTHLSLFYCFDTFAIQPSLSNIVGTRDNIASFGTLIHDEMTLVVSYPNKNASGTLRLLKDAAVIEITSVPDLVNYRGEQPTPRSVPKECLPCYEMDPTDPDICIHQELYFGDPRGSGHSYKRSAFDMYSEAQRLEWRSRFAITSQSVARDADNTFYNALEAI